VIGPWLGGRQLIPPLPWALLIRALTGRAGNTKGHHLKLLALFCGLKLQSCGIKLQHGRLPGGLRGPNYYSKGYVRREHKAVMLESQLCDGHHYPLRLQAEPISSGAPEDFIGAAVTDAQTPAVGE
jgi:hypothetical protein